MNRVRVIARVSMVLLIAVMLASVAIAGDAQNVSLVGFYDTEDLAWWVYVSGTYAYVADYGAGLRIIDVSDPTSPSEVGVYDTEGLAHGVYVSGIYAYLADGDDGLYILQFDPLEEPTGVEEIEIRAPRMYHLAQNHPNPFNPETTISYDIVKTGTVRLSIYALTGQLVRTLVDGERPAGSYFVTWDGTDDTGQGVASGVYLCRMETEEYRAVRKLVLIR